MTVELPGTGPAVTAGHQFPRRTSRARGTRPAEGPAAWRWPVLAFLVLALVGVGLAATTTSTSPPPAPTLLASAAAPVGADSSSWYCTGGSGTASGVASATLYLVNRGRRAVTGTVTVAATGGASATTSVKVPAGGETTVVPSSVEQGSWLASEVQLAGGGVAVSELVDGPQGWSQAPCASATSPYWYFASGATDNGNLLYVSLFNPTATVAVVDLSFATPKGVTRPQPFEGLVVPAGSVVVAGVASYVQDQSSVATTVEARSGRVVATELGVHDAGGTSGLSLRLGSPALAASWTLPRTVDTTGGTGEMVVYNPTGTSQQVRVAIRLPSGPVAPFVHRLPADSSWTLVTSRAARIPVNTDFATTVTASGAGVVVERVVESASSGTAPQWGTASAVPAAASAVGSGEWVLPNPALPASPAVSGASLFALDLQNTGSHTITVSVSRLTAGGDRRLGKVPELKIPPKEFTVIEASTLVAAGTDPLVIRSTGPLSAMEDATPAGMPGVVSLAAIPQRH